MVANKQIKKWQQEIVKNERIIEMHKHQNSREAYKAAQRIEQLNLKIDAYKSSPFLKSFGDEQNES